MKRKHRPIPFLLYAALAIVDRGSFLIAGRASHAHLLMALADNDDDNAANYYDLNLKASYRLKKNRLYLSGYLGNDNITFSNVLENEYGNISGNLRWNHIASDNLFTNLSVIFAGITIRSISITSGWPGMQRLTTTMPNTTFHTS